MHLMDYVQADTSILLGLCCSGVQTNTHNVWWWWRVFLPPVYISCLHNDDLFIRREPGLLPVPLEADNTSWYKDARLGLINSLSSDIHSYAEYVKTPAGGMRVKEEV